MPKMVIDEEGIKVTGWGDFWLVRLEAEFTTEIAALFDSVFGKDELFDSGLPYIIDVTSLPTLGRLEIKSFFEIKKAGINFSLLGKEVHFEALTKAGVRQALLCGTSLKQVLTTLSMPYKPRVDAELINPFLEGALRSVGTILGTPAVAGKAFVIKGEIASDVMGVIALVGPMVSGTMSLEFSTETFDKMFTRFSTNSTTAENKTSKSEFASEIINSIHVDAIKKANQSGFMLQPTVPSVLIGASQSIKVAKFSVGIPIQTNLGSFNFTVRLDI